jgi:hypothetical protein
MQESSTRSKQSPINNQAFEWNYRHEIIEIQKINLFKRKSQREEEKEEKEDLDTYEMLIAVFSSLHIPYVQRNHLGVH